MYMQRKKSAKIPKSEITRLYEDRVIRSPNDYLFECDYAEEDVEGEDEVRPWL